MTTFGGSGGLGSVRVMTGAGTAGLGGSAEAAVKGLAGGVFAIGSEDTQPDRGGPRGDDQGRRDRTGP